MKAARPYPRIIITPKGEAALTGGHPWVYEGEVTAVDGAAEDGGLVDVVSRRGSWLGCGFYNSRSKIRVRLVSRNANDDFSDAFWERRIRYAWEYRKTVMGETDSRCCRVIFGEADLFPGLTVDRFESVLVTQTLSLGMERIKSRLFPPAGQGAAGGWAGYPGHLRAQRRGHPRAGGHGTGQGLVSPAR